MNTHVKSHPRPHLTLWVHYHPVIGAAVLAILLTGCAALETASQERAQCFLSEAGSPITKVCRVFSLSDWEALGLKPLDRISSRVLDGVTKAVERNEASANFYPTFVQRHATELPIAIVDKDGWVLEALLKSTANKASCSYVRDADALLREFGGDNQGTPEDKKQGNRCGNIAIIHSLLRLDVLTEAQAFQGQFLNPTIVSRLDQFHGNGEGMTPDQQRRGYASFNTATARIDCSETLSGSVSDKGSLLKVGKRLNRLMQSDNPRYDCSLGMRADESVRVTGFRHVEHVTEVSVSQDGKYTIKTLDGFQQGQAADKIPKKPATNTWTISGAEVEGGLDWIQLQESTSEHTKRRYSDIPPDWIEMRCCKVVRTPGQ